MIENRSLFPLGVAISIMIAMVALSYLQYTDTDYLRRLGEIQNTTSDPVEAIVNIEYLKAERKTTGLESPMLTMAVVWVPVMLLYGILYLASDLLPAYNFLWGDYVTEYRRKRAIGKVVFASIFGSIALGVAGNFTYNLLFGP